MTLKEALDYRDELLAEDARIERRRQKFVKAVAWIMLSPVLPLALLCFAAEAVQRLCERGPVSRYVERVAAWAEKRGVDLSS